MDSIKAMDRPQWARPKRDKYLIVKMLSLTCIVVFFACWALADGFTNRTALDEPLRFTDNGTFQISIFEDLHFGEGTSDLVAIKTCH